MAQAAHDPLALYGMIPAAVAISFAAVAGSIIAADRAGIALASTKGIRRVLPVTGTGALIMLIVGVAVLGVALGSLVPNQTLAVAGALAWIAIVEHILVNFVPAVGRWLPAAAGQAIVRTPLDDLLSPLAGTVLLVAYPGAIALAGVRVAATRDA